MASSPTPLPGAHSRAPPEFKGMLFIKERARRRLSAFIEGSAKKDVIDGSNKTTVRRRSLSNQFDGAPVVKKYYFELTGHLLAWYEQEPVNLAPVATQQQGPAMQAKGQVSILSANGIYRLTKDQVPSPFVGGFCISDAATDPVPRRGDILVYSDNSLQLANWIGLLETAFKTYHYDPLLELGGPTQAANQKPIVQGEIFARDTFDGLPLDTWTKLHVSLFDNRLEFRSLHQQANEPRRRSSMFKSVATSLIVPTVRVDVLTVNFYVGDSRVCPNAFLVSDFTVTHHFAAKDHMEKLFWMQTIAKMLRQLVAIHEHAITAKSAVAKHAPRRNSTTAAKGHIDSDDEDDDEDDDDEVENGKDQQRPPQVRRESMYRYYGLKMPPQQSTSEGSIVLVEDESEPSPTSKPPQPPAENRFSRVQGAVAKSIGAVVSSGNRKKAPQKQQHDALTVFYQEASAPWVDEEFERLKRAAQLAFGNNGAGPVKIPFGALAKAWGENQADALGGILLRAKRNGLAKYEGDMLFKDYDDAVMVEIKG